MPDEIEGIWLPDPAITDDTYAKRGEQTFDWLARSTLPRAVAYRRFLNQILTSLPDDAQIEFKKQAYSRGNAAVFELIVAQVLNILGANLIVEAENADGKHPDYIAEFEDQSVVVEATAPVFNADAGEQAKADKPLLDIIESLAPNGWIVSVWELPDIGPNESKSAFKSAVKRMLNLQPPRTLQDKIELLENLPSGRIRLTLFASKSGRGYLGTESVITSWDNTEERVRYAVSLKRRQVRASTLPVILAINATGMASSFNDFNKALFGHTRATVNMSGQIVATRFVHDGIFQIEGDRQPTFAGVLAFLNVGVMGGPSPVLYIHPRFSGELPQVLLQLEQRRYNPDQGIVVTPSRLHNLMSKIDFVQPRELPDFGIKVAFEDDVDKIDLIQD